MTDSSPPGGTVVVDDVWLPWPPAEAARRLARPKDEADFAGVLPLLSPQAREWLCRALRRVHPGHAWIGAL